jgi:thiol-disulfide isomerase/thioredoxin
MTNIYEISNPDDFRAYLKSSEEILVHAIYANWCGPCQKYKPEFESIAASYADKSNVKFSRSNVDYNLVKPIWDHNPGANFHIL